MIKLKKLLIAIRVMRAASEMGIRTVAIYAPDKSM
jgi:pyruvate carboxylase